MRKLTELATLGLGMLMVFSVSEAGIVSSDMVPTSKPAALESTDGSYEVAVNSGQRRSETRTSREDRRARTKAKLKAKRTRNKRIRR